MSFFAVIFKVIPYILPFLKEMLIGRKTWRQAFRENRGKTILAFVIVISVVFNIVLTAKVGSMAFQILELSRAKQELEHKFTATKQPTEAVPSSARHPVVNNTEISAEVKKDPKPLPVLKEKATAALDPIIADEVKAQFERIRQREAASEH